MKKPVKACRAIVTRSTIDHDRLSLRDSRLKSIRVPLTRHFSQGDHVVIITETDLTELLNVDSLDWLFS
jgi:hypothetical protein